MQRRFLVVPLLVLVVAGAVIVLRPAGDHPATLGSRAHVAEVPGDSTALEDAVVAASAPGAREPLAFADADPDPWTALTAAADALPRFDPGQWPPLPADDAPFDAVADDLMARAESGDAGAACWLSEQVARCRDVLDLDHRIRRGLPVNQSAQASLDPKSLSRCQSVPAGYARQVSRLIRQAAIAGSWRAIRAMANGGYLMEPGFPEAGPLRQSLDEREAMIWAAIRIGVPDARSHLWSETFGSAFYNQSSPEVPALSRADRDALGYLHDQLQARSAVIEPSAQPRRGPAMPFNSGVPMSAIPPHQRLRLERLADRLVHSMSDPAFRVLSDRAFGKSTRDGCAVFGPPVDLAMNLKRLVGP